MGVDNGDKTSKHQTGAKPLLQLINNGAKETTTSCCGTTAVNRQLK